MASFNINTIFKNDSDELNLYSVNIDEDSDSIKIITNVRQPALKRGSVGDLIFVSKTPLDGTEIRDAQRMSFNISYCVDLWIMNSFSFCRSQKICTLPLFLKALYIITAIS